MHGAEETVAFRLWPPIAIGGPLVLGWLVTAVLGDPVELGEWRVPLGWALVLVFVGWNGWALWLFHLVTWGAIRPEERFLRERLGAPYEDYARRVRRWL